MATKISKCLCGGKAEMFVGPYGAFYKCKKCGKKAPGSWDTGKAELHWNDMIEKEKKSKK